MKGFKADLCYWRPGFKFFVPIFVPYSQPNVCPGGNTHPFRLFKWDHMLKNRHLFIVFLRDIFSIHLRAILQIYSRLIAVFGTGFVIYIASLIPE